MADQVREGQRVAALGDGQACRPDSQSAAAWLGESLTGLPSDAASEAEEASRWLISFCCRVNRDLDHRPCGMDLMGLFAHLFPTGRS